MNTEQLVKLHKLLSIFLAKLKPEQPLHTEVEDALYFVEKELLKE